MSRRALFAVAFALVAGCVGETTIDGGDAALDGHAPASAQFDLRATGCAQGGGHSVYNHGEVEDYLPSPWQFADASDELGHPMHTTYGLPVTGPVTGILHTTITCETWTLGDDASGVLIPGFVGIQVEPPSFDAGGADIHYLIEVFSSSEPAIEVRLASTGFHASAGAGVIEWLAPGVLHTVLEDEHRGVYESYLANMQDYRALEPRVVRLWMLHEIEEGYRPMALDLHDGAATHLLGDGVLSHLGPGDHPPPPGAAGKVAGLAYLGFDREILVGAAPDVVLEETWVH